MRWFSLTLLMALLFPGIAGPLTAQEPTDEELLRQAAAKIPAPPMQDAPWAPPEGASENEVLACRAAFAAGLADPRGLPYREVYINVYPRDNRITLTHAWVLPGETHAVVWNGLIYRIERVGDPADWKADFAATGRDLDEEEQGPYHPAQLGAELAYDVYYTRAGDAQSGFRNEHAVRKLMHLRLLGETPGAPSGEADETDVEGQLKTYLAGDDAGFRLLNLGPAFQNIFHEQMSYLLWLHEYQQLPEAAVLLQQMQKTRQLSESLPREADPSFVQSFPREKFEIMFRYVERDFEFLWQEPQIRQDTARRLREETQVGPRLVPPGPMDSFQPQKSDYPDPTLRLAAYLDALDQVNMTRWLADRIAEDEELNVPRIIAAVAEDDRLSRVREDYRSRGVISDFERVVPVFELVVKALEKRFSTEFELPEGREYLKISEKAERRRLAENIGQFWKKHRQQGPAERWHSILADDQATVEQWLLAASHIIDALPHYQTIEDVDGLHFIWLTSGSDRSWHNLPLAGETLRGTAHPSVPDLLAQRIWQVAEGPDFENRDRAAGQLAETLARWQGPAALQEIRSLYAFYWQKVYKSGDTLREMEYDFHPPKDPLWVALHLLGWRLRLEDPSAVEDYRDVFAQIHQEYGVQNFEMLLKPGYLYQDQPAVEQLMEQVLLEPETRWFPLVELLGPEEFAKLTTGNAMSSRVFQRKVVQILKNGTEELGALTITNDRHGHPYEYQAVDEIGQKVPFGSVMPDDPTLGAPAPVMRVKDLVARYVARRDGSPRFSPAWPREQRDAAVVAQIEYITRFSQLLVEKPITQSSHSLAPLVLQAPATPADVEDGRALFALENPGQILELDRLPHRACWITWRGHPFFEYDTDIYTGQRQPVVRYQRRGEIYQAEIDADGRRWFGFVHPYGIDKVPGDEISLTYMLVADYGLGSGWEHIAPGFIVRLKDGALNRGLTGETEFTLEDGKRTLPLWIHNITQAQLPPPEMFLAGPAETLADLGLRMRVQHWPVPPTHISNAKGGQELDPQQPVRVVPHRDGIPCLLAIEESAHILTLDLTEAFDFSEPGGYRLDLVHQNSLDTPIDSALIIVP